MADLTTTPASPQAGQTARESFDSRELAVTGDTQAAALAAQVTASVQANYLMALKRPRDIDQARVDLLKECKRPGFAASARYRLPRGGKTIVGPSIRFAEAAIRCMKNILVRTSAIYDSPEKRIVSVQVTDLESNVPYSIDVTIAKTVERSFVDETRHVLSQRKNSQGKTTYLVAATDDEMLAKEGALVSKAIRTLALRILPGDLLDDAMNAVQATISNKAAEDPTQARKEMVDAFAAVGVMPANLVAFLEHKLETVTPAEHAELQTIYRSVRDGEATWKDVIAAEREPAATGAAPTNEPVGTPPPAATRKPQETLEEKRARAKANLSNIGGGEGGGP